MYKNLKPDAKNTQLANKPSFIYSAKCNQKEFPGFYSSPREISVIGSKTETPKYEILKSSMEQEYLKLDRIVLRTPWGNYVIFKSLDGYFLYYGCTCDLDKFRLMDIRKGTAGLLCFDNVENVIDKIFCGKNEKMHEARSSKAMKNKTNEETYKVDDIVKQYGNEKTERKLKSKNEDKVDSKTAED